MRVQDEVMGVGKGRGEMRGKGENMDFRYVTKLATKNAHKLHPKIPKNCNHN